jgi:hypothetical protein
MLGLLGEVHSAIISVLTKDNLFFWGSAINIEEINKSTDGGTCQGQVLFLTFMLGQLGKGLLGRVRLGDMVEC